MIGATFAIVIVLGLIGQLLGVQTVVDQDHRFYAYVVFGFLSGFSERWAQNLLSGGHRESRPGASLAISLEECLDRLNDHQPAGLASGLIRA